MLLMNLTEQTITRTEMNNAFAQLGIKVKLESMKPLVARKKESAIRYGEMISDFRAMTKVQWQLVLQENPKYQKHLCFAVEMGDYWTSSNIKQQFWYKYINAWMLNESMTKRAFIYEVTTKQLVEIKPASNPLESYTDIMETFRYIYDMDTVAVTYGNSKARVHSYGDRYDVRYRTFSFSNYLSYEADEMLEAYEEEVTRLTGISMDDGRPPEEDLDQGEPDYITVTCGQPLMSNSTDFQDPELIYLAKESRR